MKTIIIAIREWYYANRLKAQKRRAIFEVEQDLRFIEKFKGDMLKYDESKARKRMAELRRKETRTEVDETELEQVMGIISMSKAVKNEWEKSTELKKDLEKYVSLM